MTSSPLSFDYKSLGTPVLILLTILSCLATGQNVQPTAVVATPNLTANQNCTVNTTKPTPPIGNYAFKAVNSTQTCLNAKFSAYIIVEQGKYLNLIGGNTSQLESDCGVSNGNGTKPAKLVVNYDCNISIGFSISSNGTYTSFITSIDGKFPDGNVNRTFSNTTVANIFNTKQSGHYYKCTTEQPILLNLNEPTPNKTKPILMISNFALEAFRDVSGNEFYQIPEECALDSGSVSDLVRVGVGVCLVALVAIVLIAYFIGRRRWSERSSYESV